MVEFAFGPHLAHSTLGFERILIILQGELLDNFNEIWCDLEKAFE